MPAIHTNIAIAVPIMISFIFSIFFNVYWRYAGKSLSFYVIIFYAILIINAFFYSRLARL